jgi:hypothetical protein
MSAPFNQSNSWSEGIQFIHPIPSHRTADALFAKHGMVRLLLTAVTTRVRGSLSETERATDPQQCDHHSHCNQGNQWPLQSC